MALIKANRVKETTTTTGTGNVTLAGAATGFQGFGSVMANNDTCLYCIAGGAEWEIGIGTYVSATPALARTTVLSSSNSGSLVNFSSGTKDVFITEISERFILPQLTSDPTGPQSGVSLYSRSLAGRHLPRFVGPSGVDTAVQPSLWGNSITIWLPGTGTTASISFGVSWTVSATQAHPSIADTNIMTRIKRATYTTTTTAGNAAGARTTATVVLRNAGFYFAARGGILTYQSAMQVFFGLSAASGIITGDPNAANNSCGFGKQTGATVWSYWTRDGTTTNNTNTSENTAAGGSTDVYDFYLFCKPGDSKITFRMVDITGPTVIVDNVELSSNLPDGATGLYAHAECRNVTGGAGTAVAIFLSKIYLETDL